MLMDRKDFIRRCGMGCLAMLSTASLLEGCAGARYLNGVISGADMLIPLSDFEINKRGMKQYRQYVIAQNEQLLYPICVYRLSEREYHALWLRCTHQGTELQVFGDRLQCPAHGSEFSSNGAVRQGPADEGLRTFPVSIDNNVLKIDLR